MSEAKAWVGAMPAQPATVCDEYDYDMQRGLLECIGQSQTLWFFWPDCSSPRIWFPGKRTNALGYGPGDLEPHVSTFFGLLHPEDRPPLEARLRAIAIEKRTGEYGSVYRLRDKSGNYRWVRGSVSVCRRPGSERLFAMGFARIIDRDLERERVARQVTESALQALLDEIGHPVLMISPDGFVLQNNDAAERLIPAAQSSVIRYCPFLHEPDGTRTMPGFLEHVLRNRERQERQLWRFDRWWHVYLVPVRGVDQNGVRVLLLAQDISAHKEEQAAQIAREKALTQTLVREIHHRIKNHLQGVVGLLRAHAQTPRPAGQVLDTAITEILSIATVYGLLARDGQASVEFMHLVDQIVATVRIGASVPVRFTIDSAHWQPTSLTQEEAVPLAIATGELITNAVKHTRPEPGARVEGSLSYTEGGLQLDIVNSPATLPQGFQTEGTRGNYRGLDLVQALLPRGRSQLQIIQDGVQVRTRLVLMRQNAPRRPSPSPPAASITKQG